MPPRSGQISPTRCCVCSCLLFLVSAFLLGLLVSTTSASYYSNFGLDGIVVPHENDGDVEFFPDGLAKSSGAVDWYRFDTIPSSSHLLDPGDAFNVKVCLKHGDAKKFNFYITEGRSLPQHPEKGEGVHEVEWVDSTCFRNRETTACTTSLYVGVQSATGDDESYKLHMHFNELVDSPCYLGGITSSLFYIMITLLSCCALCWLVSMFTACILCCGDKQVN